MKYTNKSKKELIYLIYGFKGQIGNLKRSLNEYRVSILFHRREVKLCKAKLNFLERKRRTKLTYTSIGRNHPKNIKRATYGYGGNEK